MTEPREFKLDKIPEGSRLEKYFIKLNKILEGNRDEFLEFLREVFLECLEFLKENLDIVTLPQFTLQFVSSHDAYKRTEQNECEGAILYEEAKAPSYAFIVGNRFRARIYLDTESHVDLLRHGSCTFIINLVETYIHEILHMAFPRKSEQETWDLQCSSVEFFLGIELPDEVKKLKASDYYEEKSGNL